MPPSRNPKSKKPLRETIYADLKRQILSGQLPPGSRVVEIALADRQQVSRTVIREVIKQLELEGLVRITPYKGTEVARFSLKDIEEIYAIQATLEGMAADLSTAKMTEADKKDLHRIQKQLREALHKTPGEWQKMNVRFHQFFIERCGNWRLQNLVKNQHDQFARYWRIILAIPGQRERNSRGHEKILQAIASRDSLKVRLAMEEHIHQTAKNLMEFLGENSFLI